MANPTVNDCEVLYVFIDAPVGLRHAEALKRRGVSPDVFQRRIGRLIRLGFIAHISGALTLTEAGGAALRGAISEGWRPARPRFLRSENLDIAPGQKKAERLVPLVL